MWRWRQRRKLAICWPITLTPATVAHGPISEVVAMTETFIKERKHNLTGRVEPVGIDDASAFLCRFQKWIARNVLTATRYARGHKALYTLEINGEHASARWICTICIASSISITATKDKRAAGAASHVTDGESSLYEALVGAGATDRVTKHTFIHQFADFLQALGAVWKRRRHSGWFGH